MNLSICKLKKKIKNILGEHYVTNTKAFCFFLSIYLYLAPLYTKITEQVENKRDTI